MNTHQMLQVRAPLTPRLSLSRANKAAAAAAAGLVFLQVQQGQVGPVKS